MLKERWPELNNLREEVLEFGSFEYRVKEWWTLWLEDLVNMQNDLWPLYLAMKSYLIIFDFLSTIPMGA